MRWLFPEEQRAEHERAKKIARKWRTRNMRWYDRLADRFIRYIRDNPNIKSIPIGGDEDPYLRRWFVIPRNRWCNLYLHNFLHDDPEDLHDHRMLNISWVIQGPGYEEEVFLAKPRSGYPLPRIGRRRVRRFIPRMRFPSTAHRIVLPRDVNGRHISSWSLFFGFPHWRDWGFWCPGIVLPASNVETKTQYRTNSARWVPWQEYIGDVNPTDPRYGVKGRGCG